ncbi:MAG: hypothetical protein JJU41_07760 [Bacteroidetes bacterium]|nr:hypothetical protein [Bacteroidota bacterium]
MKKKPIVDVSVKEQQSRHDNMAYRAGLLLVRWKIYLHGREYVLNLTQLVDLFKQTRGRFWHHLHALTVNITQLYGRDSTTCMKLPV